MAARPLVYAYDSGSRSLEDYVSGRRRTYSFLTMVFWNNPGNVGLSGEGINVRLSAANAGGSVGLTIGGRLFDPSFYSQSVNKATTSEFE